MVFLQKTTEGLLIKIHRKFILEYCKVLYEIQSCFIADWGVSFSFKASNVWTTPFTIHTPWVLKRFKFLQLAFPYCYPLLHLHNFLYLNFVVKRCVQVPASLPSRLTSRLTKPCAVADSYVRSYVRLIYSLYWISFYFVALPSGITTMVPVSYGPAANANKTKLN